MAPAEVRAKTFFLNEQHELSRGEYNGGGRTPRYAPIDWKDKGTRLSASLRKTKEVLAASLDPIAKNHYFILAKPAKEIVKISTDKNRAPDGLLHEPVQFGDQHSRVFNRLDMDLLRVTDDGSAIVHVLPDSLEKLSKTSETLDSLGTREQSRWVAFEGFQEVPSSKRLDLAWAEGLDPNNYADAVLEFQPFLNRAEIDRLLRSIVERLHNARERIHSTGTDFSGRQWMRGSILRSSLFELAETYFSIQSLHSPLIADANGSTGLPGSISSGMPSAPVVGQLPVIAVVDTGVPADHPVLNQFRRGTYVSPNSYANNPDPHGPFVASRVVFGAVDEDPAVSGIVPLGSAQFYDINICGINEGEVDTKSVYPALQAVVATAPDVRVFNCSFDTSPISMMSEIKREEFLSLVRDLDNFIFQNDILVVFAAGNSPKGIIPTKQYPNHGDEGPWQFGAWARSFNSLTCGSLVNSLTGNGLVKTVGWPSPFCRVGPGLCGSIKPDFSSNGGNCTPSYQFEAGLGVWGLTPDGFWTDLNGTSHAAPILSRQAALAFQALQAVCERGSRPFAVTVKAFLALTAIKPDFFMAPQAVVELGKRTLGFGQAEASRLWDPEPSRAVMIWQGSLEDDKDIARIEMPIPIEWLKQASEPYLRIVIASDPPANSALTEQWATRKVTCHIRPQSDTRAISSQRSGVINSYPLFQRSYKIPKNKAEGDLWIVELSYEVLGDYYPAMNFSSRQRIAFAAELVDLGPTNATPQVAIQSLPVAATMTRLSAITVSARTPVVVRPSL